SRRASSHAPTSIATSAMRISVRTSARRSSAHARFTTSAPNGPPDRLRRPMPGPSLELQTLKAEFFRALAHPVRIRLLEALVAGGEQNVQTLQQRLGIDQP